MTTVTGARRTSAPRLSQVVAMVASMAAILVGFLAFAPAPSATAGVIINGDALTVALSPWGDHAMIVSNEVEDQGLYHRTFATAGAAVKLAYPSSSQQRVEVYYVLQTQTQGLTGWTEVQRSAKKQAYVGGSNTAYLGADSFQLPYEYTEPSASFRIVYEATWYSAGSPGTLLHAQTLVPNGNGSVACFNRALTCTPRPLEGRVVV